MILPEFDSITGAHIDELKTNQISEHRTLDYKRSLYGDGDKHEFLKDVSSFANTNGGHILLGVTEATDASGKKLGYPSAINGVEPAAGEGARSRMAQWAHSGLDPGLQIQTKLVKCGDSTVAVIEVPPSIIAPHMVTDTGRFYYRTSTGAERMETTHLRHGFVNAALFAEVIRERHRAEFNAAAATTQTLTFVSLVPWAAPRGAIDIAPSLLKRQAEYLRPIEAEGWGQRVNVDGYRTEEWRGGKVWSYVQAFRHGTIEAMTRSILGSEGFSQGSIPAPHFAHVLLL